MARILRSGFRLSSASRLRGFRLLLRAKSTSPKLTNSSSSLGPPATYSAFEVIQRLIEPLHRRRRRRIRRRLDRRRADRSSLSCLRLLLERAQQVEVFRRTVSSEVRRAICGRS